MYLFCANKDTFEWWKYLYLISSYLYFPIIKLSLGFPKEKSLKSFEFAK